MKIKVKPLGWKEVDKNTRRAESWGGYFQINIHDYDDEDIPNLADCYTYYYCAHGENYTCETIGMPGDDIRVAKQMCQGRHESEINSIINDFIEIEVNQ